MAKTKRTLILALAPFGDAALVVGPLAAWRAARPDEHVTLAGATGVCEIVTTLGLVDEVWEAGGALQRKATADKSSPVVVAAAGSADLYRSASLLLRARRARFDSVVDLFPKPGSLLVSWAAGGRRSKSGEKYLDAFLKGRSAQAPVDPVDRIAALLGVDTKDVGLDLRSDPESDAWIERALSAIGYRGGGSIAVVHSNDRWTTMGFVEVADRLRVAFNAWPVALDTPRESGLARHIAGGLGGSVLGVAAPSGARFIAALERASLVVTDDMSVAHLARLGHVPAVFVSTGGPYALAPSAGLEVVDASDTEAVYDAACVLITKHRTGALFDRG